MLVDIVLTLIVIPGLAAAVNTSPLALTGSEWVGVDGNWSALQFDVGKPGQEVNVLVSTALSEFWVIGSGGCSQSDPTCINARGGIFEPSSSSDWSSIGTWQLGLDYPGYEANGNYGLDTINANDFITNDDFSMSGTLLAVINTTNYFNGYFGLGITPGRFNNEVVKPPLVEAVEVYGRIPGYSYGFTAGASYRNMPASLTLGGYDKSRFEEQQTNFVLSQDDDLPHPLIRAIELVPGTNETQGEIVSSWNESFTAVIDSTTPYLWLPEDVCERLADNLNLTYDSTFDLYTLSNDLYQEYQSSTSMALTFSLSSLDNTDDLGNPLNAPGVVNITIPLKAFLGTIQYPFMGGEAIGYGDPAVPYFTLRRAPNNSTYIIGRSFLQESYLITNYDQRVFSVHQALFPEDPADGADIRAIEHTSDSPYPGPGSGSPKGLSTATIAGLAAGLTIGCIVALVLALLWRRRRRVVKRSKSAETLDDAKDSGSSLSSDGQQNTLGFWGFFRRKARSTSSSTEKHDPPSPTEAAEGQIYEMPAPVPPAELDSYDHGELTGDTQLHFEGEEHLSLYEQTRRKLERQIQGPVPAYSPPQHGGILPPEKITGSHDLLQTQDTIETLSPVSPASGGFGTNSNSLPSSLPSPISSRTDSNGDRTDNGQTLATDGTFPSLGDAQNHIQGGAASSSPLATQQPFQPHPPALHRTPIDPSNVVFLGNLPEHITYPRRRSLPRIDLALLRQNGPDPIERPASAHERPVSTLGSNYTEEQEPSARSAQQSRGPLNGDGRRETSISGHGTPISEQRISPDELIHVPQLAARRYSWEDTL